MRGLRFNFFFVSKSIKLTTLKTEEKKKKDFNRHCHVP
jgi:hypothetical protein